MKLIRKIKHGILSSQDTPFYFGLWSGIILGLACYLLENFNVLLVGAGAPFVHEIWKGLRK